ncbi:MliC family protein [Marinobacter salexigens]|uniref:MliC family protein n=1 Tax=Marinobacter salexigens TaxID=1925763 RepID=UPI000C283F51|nr:MliC family protein [Marinobacter salexigens]
MRIYAPVTLASALLLAACGSAPQNNTNTQAVHNYQCDSGNTVAATYPSSDSAKIEYKGSTYSMQIAVSASGARYVGDDLEWWTKGSGSGSEGTLLHHLDDNTSGEIIESCTKS